MAAGTWPPAETALLSSRYPLPARAGFVEDELRVLAQLALDVTAPEKRSPQEQPCPGEGIVSMVREKHVRKLK